MDEKCERKTYVQIMSVKVYTVQSIKIFFIKHGLITGTYSDIILNTS